MNSYLTAFAGTFFSLFLILWAVVRFDFEAIAEKEYQITKAHDQMIAKCSLGDVDILGDSSGNADFIPSRIGPGVESLAFGGGTPVEVYYIAKSLLKCQNKPKVVILSFVGSAFSFHPNFPDPQNTLFWLRGFKFGLVNYADAIDVLKYSRQFHDPVIAGARSLFDVDYRIKAASYAINFPPYYSPDIATAIFGVVKFRVAKNPILVSTIYQQTMADNGHHFYGTDAESGVYYDHSAFATDDRIAPLLNFYMRRTIEMLSRNGITVLLVEPPANHYSAIHYKIGLVDVYQNYLRSLESSEPDTKVIGVGLQIWQPTLFGDTVHLNLRGALANSEYLRESLNKAGENDITFSDVAPTPINLYAQNDQTQFWAVPPAIQGAKISLVTDAPLPKLAYPGSSAWLYEIPDDTSGQTVVGVQARAIALDAKTNYALSVLVKPINTGEVSLHLDWPGGSRGSVGWDFKKRLISYSGKMNMLNSGVVTCLGGWVELYLSATSGSIATSYPGSVVSLSAADDASAPASAYVYNATLERGLWPTNYCTLQPDEVSTIPLPAKAASGSNVHNNFGTK